MIAKLRRALRRMALLSSLAAFALLAPIAQPAFAAALATELTAEAKRIVGADQGVQVEAEDGTLLVSQAASRAVHPASVSKIPTTLALLRKLGPDHRFETRFLAGGKVEAGVLRGPLVVEGAGDPYFVDENALLAARALRDRGLKKVEGELVVRGRLLFDWKPDALAPRIRRVLEGGAPAVAWQAVRARTGDANAQAPKLVFAKSKSARPGSGESLLLTHRSQPLRFMLKALNGYSNNIFAPFAEAAGGIASVQEKVRATLPEALRGELVLGDGAGAHPANRLSPRAAVAILQTLAKTLAEKELDLADVMPVAGVDEGTLKKRLDAPGERGIVVAKTGTFGDYGASALAGALRTKNHGVVYFAVLNHGVPIEEARRRQDAFAKVLIRKLEGRPWGYARDDAPAFTRAEVVVAPTR